MFNEDYELVIHRVIFNVDLDYICNRMIGVVEQDLCMPSLFSICLGIRFNTSIWNSPVNHSCFPNKKAETQ